MGRVNSGCLADLKFTTSSSEANDEGKPVRRDVWQQGSGWHSWDLPEVKRYPHLILQDSAGKHFVAGKTEGRCRRAGKVGWRGKAIISHNPGLCSAGCRLETPPPLSSHSELLFCSVLKFLRAPTQQSDTCRRETWHHLPDNWGQGREKKHKCRGPADPQPGTLNPTVWSAERFPTGCTHCLRPLLWSMKQSSRTVTEWEIFLVHLLDGKMSLLLLKISALSTPVGRPARKQDRFLTWLFATFSVYSGRWKL